MTNTITAPTCARCDTATTERSGWRWCEPCGIWLEHDKITGEWISPAEHISRRTHRDTARIIAAQTATARTEYPAVRATVPDDYTLTAALTIEHGSTKAALHYDPDRDHWHVTIHERKVTAPIYAAGGAHVAYYRSATDAARAAIARLPRKAP